MEKWLVENISVLIPGVGFTGLIGIWILIKNPKILDALRTRGNKTLTQDEEEIFDDSPHLHHRSDRRRASDVMLDKFFELQEKQTEFREKLLNLHNEALLILKNQDTLLAAILSQQRDMERNLRDIYDWVRPSKP